MKEVHIKDRETKMLGNDIFQIYMLLLLVVEHFIFQMEHLENRVGKVSGVLSA
jgi:hypothetical protein